MLLKLIYLVTFVNCVNCARILGAFFVPSISHQVVYQSIWKELSLRGHEVTVMSPDILKDPTLSNLTEIDLSFSYNIIKQAQLDKNMPKDNYLIQNILFVFRFFQDVIHQQIQHKAVQNLINNKDIKFDLIVVECLHPLWYSLGSRFKAPVVGVSSLGALLHSHDAMGNPTHPVITPDILMNLVGKPTFTNRLHSTFYNIWYRILYYGYFLPQADSIARKYFGKDMPYLGDLEKNVSLLLLNVNPILHPIRANVPTIIELGQMHIKPKKPLPQDLQTFLDKSTEGVIYFSLGSNVKSANLTENVRKIIVSALSELPYKVLWKWESDYLPDRPKNVLTKKWLPQQDVLGHPNIKAFVTQGGLQSMEEAITNSVPLIGMPFFGDQPLNVVKMIEMGIAKSIDFTTMTKDELKSVIIEVATNKMYRENVEKIKTLLVDQPMTGLEKAIWWIEYIIRHKGAAHLKSPAAEMPWIQYFLLDVVGFVLIISVLFTYIIYLIIHLLMGRSNKDRKLKFQ